MIQETCLLSLPHCIYFKITKYSDTETQRGHKITGEWPKELDSLVATPQHHKLLKENKFVRVLDTLIPPGEITNVHTHKWPSVLFIISWSDFIRYDGEGNIVLDSRKLSATPLTSTAIQSDPLSPHAQENTGENTIHIISFEIKR